MNTSVPNNAENTNAKSGGLYSKVNMSVKTANILVLIGIVLLVAVSAFLIRHNGFTVTFNTDGGSAVQSRKVLHSQTLSDTAQPVKQGYEFKGWYLDKDCTVEWDMQNQPVTGSMTLYAGWEPAT